MHLVEWNDEVMALNIDVIDEQHKVLLSTINQLSTAINSKKQKKEIASIVEQFLDYADYHFETEEKLLAQSNFPQRNSHIKTHKEFLNNFLKTKEMLQNIKQDSKYSLIQTSEETYEYILKWFLHHILKDDKEFALHYHKCNIESSNEV